MTGKGEYMKATGTHQLFLRLFVIFTCIATFSAANASEMMSVNADGTDGGNFQSGSPVICADGWYVAFESLASNLGPPDTNGYKDIYVRNRKTDTTILVSINADGTNGGNGNSSSPVCSANCRYVAFESSAYNFGPTDTNGATDVYVRDLFTGTTTLVSVNAAGTNSGNLESGSPAISPSGRYVAFHSRATNLMPDATVGQQVYVRDLFTGTTTLVSINADETGAGNGWSGQPVISDNGRYVVFGSNANNFGPPDVGYDEDLYVRDLVSKTTRLVSVNFDGTDGGNQMSRFPVISAGGQYVAFVSWASNLGHSDTNGISDIYVRDLIGGTTTLVSANASGTDAGNGWSNSPVISADGRYIVFESVANNFGPNDTNGTIDVYMHDLIIGLTSLVSVNATGTDSGNLGATSPAISADGRYVAFQSFSNDLGPTDTNWNADIYVRNIIDYTTTLVSVNAAGTDGGNNYSYSPVISRNGRYVALESMASNFGPPDSNNNMDVYISAPLFDPDVECIPLQISGNPSQKLDIVFMGSQESRYDSLSQLSQDALNIISNSFGKDDAIKLKMDAFNFWYIRGRALVTKETDNGCFRLDPEWQKVCPQANVGTILHAIECGDYYQGDTFSAEYTSFGTFSHESGHGVFGLEDEYDGSPGCTTYYGTGQKICASNIFRNETICQLCTHYPTGDCLEFTPCQDGWWKAQPPSTMMSCCPSEVNPSYPEAICSWGLDGQPIVESVLDRFTSAEAVTGSYAAQALSSEGKVIHFSLHYNGENIVAYETTVLYGEAPNRYLEWDGLRVVLRNSQGDNIYDFTTRDPRYRDYDFPPSGELLDEADFTLVIPFLDDAKTLDIYDAISEDLLISIDLSNAIEAFCSENPTDSQCTSVSPGNCVSSAQNLCLNNDRFSVVVDWSAAQSGESGQGTAVPLTSDSGYFWFFGENNVELLVKILDGRGVNGHFWFFWGAMTDVQYTITVTDTETGAVKQYHGTQGVQQSGNDINAFFDSESASAAILDPVQEIANFEATMQAAGSVFADTVAASYSALSLNNNRFSVEVSWSAAQTGESGEGVAVPLTSDSGYFWFFGENNVELLVKILDGRGVNGHFWFFWGAMTDVQYTITVTDTETEAVKQYHGTQGVQQSGNDIYAFYDYP